MVEDINFGSQQQSAAPHHAFAPARLRDSTRIMEQTSQQISALTLGKARSDTLQSSAGSLQLQPAFAVQTQEQLAEQTKEGSEERQNSFAKRQFCDRIAQEQRLLAEQGESDDEAEVQCLLAEPDELERATHDQISLARREPEQPTEERLPRQQLTHEQHCLVGEQRREQLRQHGRSIHEEPLLLAEQRESNRPLEMKLLHAMRPEPAGHVETASMLIDQEELYLAAGNSEQPVERFEHDTSVKQQHKLAEQQAREYEARAQQQLDQLHERERLAIEERQLAEHQARQGHLQRQPQAQVSAAENLD
jgi:hypothetical protein